MDLLLAARAHGMRAEIFNGSLSQVKDELDSGHPLIAFVNYGFQVLPIGHFMVLTGYDDGRRSLYARFVPNTQVQRVQSVRSILRKSRWEQSVPLGGHSVSFGGHLVRTFAILHRRAALVAQCVRVSLAAPDCSRTRDVAGKLGWIALSVGGAGLAD